MTCLSSAVVSSNSSPSLKVISVFLKVLWVFTVTLSPLSSMMVVGLVKPATCRVAKPTPGDRGGERVRRGTVQTPTPGITPELFLPVLGEDEPQNCCSLTVLGGSVRPRGWSRVGGQGMLPVLRELGSVPAPRTALGWGTPPEHAGAG